jgi:two-component system, chemotaxis family, chemotaxis protein CheY
MSYRVLIVDDSSVIRAMVRRTINLAGLPVGAIFEAANGKEALEILDREWIDMVLADLNMPEMSGSELVERMAADDLMVSIPVVIISSEYSPPRVEELRRRGVRAYLRKPFRPEGFRDVVLGILGPHGASHDD